MKELIMIAAALMLGWSAWASAAVGGPERVVTRFVAALQSGDVVTLRDCLAGSMAASTERLLAQNTTYPGLLRERYGSARFHLAPVWRSADFATVQVGLERPDGGGGTFVLLLQQMPEGWKVVGQRENRPTSP